MRKVWRAGSTTIQTSHPICGKGGGGVVRLEGRGPQGYLKGVAEGFMLEMFMPEEVPSLIMKGI